MNGEGKPPPALRFFCDENDLALGRGLATLRRDVVHPGHPRLPEVPRGTKDPDWIPIIGEMGLVVITRDKRIRRRAGELNRWREGKLRGFVLTGTGDQSSWESVRILAARWEAMEAFIDLKPEGPWMYGVTSSGCTEIDLDSGI